MRTWGNACARKQLGIERKKKEDEAKGEHEVKESERHKGGTRGHLIFMCYYDGELWGERKRKSMGGKVNVY